IVAFIYLLRATPLYTASTQVLLSAQREKAPGDTSSPDVSFYDQISAIENQLAILRSDTLLRRVAVKDLVPEAPLSTSQADIDEYAKKIQVGINRLRGAMAAKRSGQGLVLDISITWTDPVKAGQLANAVADAFVIDQLDARFESAKRASGWLSDRIVEL